jgi:hypothetical protein
VEVGRDEKRKGWLKKKDRTSNLKLESFEVFCTNNNENMVLIIV